LPPPVECEVPYRAGARVSVTRGRRTETGTVAAYRLRQSGQILILAMDNRHTLTIPASEVDPA
jgi:hypothetical protein